MIPFTLSREGPEREKADLCVRSRGLKCEEFLCSSDPTSLDGIIIPSVGVAVVDGTAPHVYEPKLIGAKEQIVDLSAFMKCDDLKKQRSEIEALSSAKSRRYAQIYEFLKIAKVYDLMISKTAEIAFCEEKMLRAVNKSALWLNKGETYTKKIRIRSAFTEQGSSVLESYPRKAVKRFALNDPCGFGGKYLAALYEKSERDKISVEVSYDPLRAEYPDALYYPDTGVAFYVGATDKYEETPINMRRFVDDERLRPYKSEIRAYTRLKNSVLDQIKLNYGTVKRIHFALEQIYSSAMDFNAKEKYTDILLNKIFK